MPWPLFLGKAALVGGNLLSGASLGFEAIGAGADLIEISEFMNDDSSHGNIENKKLQEALEKQKEEMEMQRQRQQMLMLGGGAFMFLILIIVVLKK